MMWLARKILISFTIVLLSASHALAQNAPVLIRDTEIEESLKLWSEPLFEVAGLSSGSVNIILIKNPQLNAFVAGGANIFLYTGLILRTETPEELIGVIAHELGHITGGHLVAQRDALERASYESIIGTILGLGAAVATGNAGAAAAISAGTQSTALRRFLSHSRVQESAADQAAITYLEGAKINPSGMSSFLEKLESEELLPSHQQSAYTRTHPITTNRIEALQRRIDKSEFKDASVPALWKEQHTRMKAKLLGFLNPGQVPWVISDHNKSIAAHYARAIAAYRNGYFDQSLAIMDAILKAEPKNAYFYELKGQILLDYGKVEEAIASYRKAIAIKPSAPLIQLALAHAMLESRNDEKYLDEAIASLKIVLQEESRSARAHRLIATAYGQQGKEPQAKLHLAEEAILQRRYPYAKRLLETALQNFKEDSSDWIKAKDALTYIENQSGAP